MLDLILDCGLFISLDAGKGNFYQLSGISESLDWQLWQIRLIFLRRDAINWIESQAEAEFVEGFFKHPPFENRGDDVYHGKNTENNT